MSRKHRQLLRYYGIPRRVLKVDRGELSLSDAIARVDLAGARSRDEIAAALQSGQTPEVTGREMTWRVRLAALEPVRKKAARPPKQTVEA